MFEYIRAVREVRPKFILWENVPGVLNTRDNAFGQLLCEIQDCGYSLAWRVLDSQFVRVPDRDVHGRIRGWYGPVAQRRRRVFLVGNLGEGSGASAAVLFEQDCLRGNLASSREKRQDLARAAKDNAGTSGGFKWHQGANAGGIGFEEEQSPTLTAEGKVPGCIQEADTLPIDTITQAHEHAVATLAFNTTNITSPANGNNPQPNDACHTLAAQDHPPAIVISTANNGSRPQLGNAVCFNGGNCNDVSHIGEQQRELSPSLRASRSGTNGTPVVCISTANTGANGSNISDQDLSYTLDQTNSNAVCIQGSMIGRSDNAGPQGDGVNDNVSFTLNTSDRHAVAFGITAQSSNSMKSSNPNSGIYEAETSKTIETSGLNPTCNQGGIAVVCAAGSNTRDAIDDNMAGTLTAHSQKNPPYIASEYIVRRLTPTECERLQGFPDGWTLLTDCDVDKVTELVCAALEIEDEKGIKAMRRKVEKWKADAPDGPRYKALGNSMATNVMLWIGERMQAVDDILTSK